MRRTLGLAFVVLFLLGLAGCGPRQAVNNPILGSWEAEAQMSILGVSFSDAEGHQAADTINRYDFYADGTGKSSIIVEGKYAGRVPGIDMGFTYTLDGDQLQLTHEDGNILVFTATFSDERLILDGRVHMELSRRE